MTDEAKSGEPKSQGWWQTLPGILTATAAIITALGSLIAALHQAEVFGGKEAGKPAPPAYSDTANPPVAAGPGSNLPSSTSDSRQAPPLNPTNASATDMDKPTWPTANGARSVFAQATPGEKTSTQDDKPPVISDKEPSADVHASTKLAVGEIVKGRLAVSSETGKFHYWSVDLEPGKYKILIELRRTDDAFGATKGLSLAWYDLDGQKVDAIGSVFDQKNVRPRGLFHFQAKKRLRLSIRVDMDWGMSDYWLGLYRDADAVPKLFIVKNPKVKELSLSENVEFHCDPTHPFDRERYYKISLPAGDYKVVLTTKPDAGKAYTVGAVLQELTEDGVVINNAVISTFGQDGSTAVKVARLSLAEKATIIFGVLAEWDSPETSGLKIEKWEE